MMLIKLLQVFSFTLNIHAGIFTNGGGNSWERDAVWFLGEDLVEYCIEINQNDELSREEASRSVKNALNQWKQFFKRNALDAMKFRNLANRNSVGVSLDFKEVEECKDPKTQIRFLFGMPTADMASIMENNPQELGLAFRNARYNHHTFRNGGTIYVSRFMKRGPGFEHILLHEIGHIFGMPHDSVPVMLNHIGDHIHNPFVASTLGQIESSTWRYRLSDGDLLDFTKDGEYDQVASSNHLLPNNGEVFGFAKDGKHTLKLQVRSHDDEGPVTLTLIGQEYPSGRSFRISGEFVSRDSGETRTKGNAGPILHSFWSSRECEGVLSGKQRLDTRVSRRSLEGSFMVGQKQYPAILQSDPASVLRVFIPESGRWWSVEDYPSVKIWSTLKR